MAWNQPGNNGQDRDPWGNRNSGNNNGDGNGNSNGNQGGRNRGASDLDDMFRKLSEKLGGFGGKKGGNSSSGQNGGPRGNAGNLLISLALGAVVVVWAASGFYTIKEAEQGVVTRFGKFYQIVEPGLNWKPTFIDEVQPVNVKTIRDLTTGGMMLTSDENMVQVEINVQYVVSDPETFLFNLTTPINSLGQATDSAVRGVIGRSEMEKILTSNRSEIRDQTRQELEETIRPYNMGISIVDVNFQVARPPEAVKAAFDDVIAAREEEQKTIRQAEAYKNEVLPLAKGNAQRMIEEATAYKTSVVMKAEGEVASFAKILPEYRAAPEITRERLYIETMEKVLSKTRKVIANDKGNSMLVLPLEQMLRQQSQSASSNTVEAPARISTPAPTVNPAPAQKPATTTYGNGGYGSHNGGYGQPYGNNQGGQ
ncbi:MULTISPECIES: FtsH protease activity modulator HflK [Enterobacterales]|uniref:FtsH protease activity modulator HflK n=2 Tax=Gammaproteobacteria TaxID=1236 RepID=UPI0008480CF1|nr:MULTISPECIES: FtsH protease activity modulator HflK [Enterobacterales]WOO50107.1 FtsH protease activity modulator HflK [Hafnia alvei]MCK9782329.1 FtsH protease activity modulator HflK [Proteus columbae]ODQ02735.1 HflK protein [Shigella sp. FC130]OEI91022.1 HflK protein [Shigella sp. FC1655]WPF04571.1 FtsH protease activity modulator HflK [Proteus vulgaris]